MACGDYTVSVDKDVCAGSQMCVGIAPEAFSLGSDGRAQFHASPDHHIVDLQDAADNCPTAAIALEVRIETE